METSLSPNWVEPQKKLSSRQPQETHDPHKLENDHGTRAQAKKPGLGWILLALILIGGGFGGLFVLGYLPMQKQQTTLHKDSENVKNAPLRVATILPKIADPIIKLTLPGEIQA